MWPSCQRKLVWIQLGFCSRSFPPSVNKAKLYQWLDLRISRQLQEKYHSHQVNCRWNGDLPGTREITGARFLSICPSRSTHYRFASPSKPRFYKDVPFFPGFRWVWSVGGTGRWEESKVGVFIFWLLFCGVAISWLCLSPEDTASVRQPSSYTSWGRLLHSCIWNEFFSLFLCLLTPPWQKVNSQGSAEQP